MPEQLNQSGFYSPQKFRRLDHFNPNGGPNPGGLCRKSHSNGRAGVTEKVANLAIKWKLIEKR